MLARTLGISQSQLHNVLKRKRKLQIALADALLARFTISVLDLINFPEPRKRSKQASNAIGSGLDSAQQNFFLGNLSRSDATRKQPASAVPKAKEKREAG